MPHRCQRWRSSRCFMSLLMAPFVTARFRHRTTPGPSPCHGTNTAPELCKKGGAIFSRPIF